jgi:peptide deformylase
MKTLDDILLLGDPRLYEVCAPVTREELPELMPVVEDLAGLVLQFRAKYGAGRAIAAPQIFSTPCCLIAAKK